MTKKSEDDILIGTTRDRAMCGLLSQHKLADPPSNSVLAVVQGRTDHALSLVHEEAQKHKTTPIYVDCKGLDLKELVTGHELDADKVTSPKGAFQKAWDEGRSLVLTNFSSSKERSDECLQAVFALCAGDANSATVGDVTFKKEDQKDGFRVRILSNADHGLTRIRTVKI